MSPAPAKRSGDMEKPGVRPLVRPRYVVSTLRFVFVDQLISNLHTSIIWRISSLRSKLGKIRNKLWEWRPFLRYLPKHIKISKSYNFNENWYLEDFRPEEYDRDQCNFKMAVILAAIFKMAAKMLKISKCSNFNENWCVGLFPHEECDSDKSDLKMASYFFYWCTWSCVCDVPIKM